MNIIQFQYTEEQKKNHVPLNLSKVFFIIVHHIACENATPEMVNKWHYNDFGWSGGLGYNEYIMKDGTVYICRGDNVGAQCSGMNSKSYGIGLEGNFDSEFDVKDSQFDSLVQRILYNKLRFSNNAEVVPHKRFTNTSCPGKNFPFNKLISALYEGQDFENDLKLLSTNGIIKTPEYWRENAVFGKLVKGEYARSLIHSIAEKL